MIKETVYKENDVYMNALDLGMSDGAALKVEALLPEYELNKNDLWFGEDGFYNAHVVSEDYTIPKYYTLVGDYMGNVLLVDDRRRGVLIFANEIKIYRAGSFGCIIQLVGSGLKEIKICDCEPLCDDDWNNFKTLGKHVKFYTQPAKIIDLV